MCKAGEPWSKGTHQLTAESKQWLDCKKKAEFKEKRKNRIKKTRGREKNLSTLILDNSGNITKPGMIFIPI